MLQNGDMINDVDTSGEFIGFQRFKLFFGTKWSEMHFEAVSAHESAHRTLEISTIYGQVQLAYKNILPHEDNWDALLWINDFFSGNSRFAQETFATWHGISVIRQLYEDVCVDDILTPEYLDYYGFAEYIVALVPGYELKRIMLFTAIFICFQSERIGRAGQHAFEKLPIETFEPLDFPDNRLQNLLEHFDTGFFRDEVERFISQCDSTSASIIEKCKDNTFDVGSVEFQKLQTALGLFQGYFYDLFNLHFTGLGSRSLPAEALPGVVDGMYGKMHELSEAEGEYEGFIPNEPKSLDELRLTILEEEEMVFNKVPILARIFPAYVFPKELKERLLKKPGGGVLLSAKHSFWINEAYEFTEAEDVKWLEMQNGVVVHLLFTVDVAGQEIIWLVPFSDLKEIMDFLYELPYTYLIHTIIYEHAVADHTFMTDWFNILMGFSENNCLLAEEAPLSLIEAKFHSPSAVISHCDLGLFIDGVFRWVGLLFEIIHEDGARQLIVMPASSYHLLMLSVYLGKQPFYLPKEQKDILSQQDRFMFDSIFYNLYKTYSFKYFRR